MRHSRYFVPEHRSDPSTREMQVLSLIVEGLQSKEIAKRLSISPKTVEFHKTGLYA